MGFCYVVSVPSTSVLDSLDKLSMLARLDKLGRLDILDMSIVCNLNDCGHHRRIRQDEPEVRHVRQIKHARQIRQARQVSRHVNCMKSE